ncbi:MAG: D-alanyl-D-alanine carboxypeptidase/D-alanyl-D-alanine-endopeptidase [bacterium]
MQCQHKTCHHELVEALPYSVCRLLLICTLILNISPSVNSQVLFKLPKKDTLKAVSPIKELQNDLESLVNNKNFENSFIGVSVISPETNEILYEKNEDKNFIPASNQKILTTATALRYLGADYKFQTRMYLDGDLEKNGEFIGDIYIRGYGDPSLSDYFTGNPFQIFNYFMKILDSLGIKSIKGDIIGDDNFFDDAFYAPGWQIDDIIYTYSAQINALSILDNKIDITIESGNSAGKPTTVLLFPNISYVHVTNNVVTSESEKATNIYAIKEACSNNIQIYGNISYDSTSLSTYKLSVTIDNPTLYFLYLFKDYLEKNSISQKGIVADIDDLEYLPDYTFLEKDFIYFSPKLSEIIKIINRESHNLAAEMLLKTIAREITGFGSTENGIEQVKKYLGRIGQSTDKIFIADGSGLSRLNMLTPNLLITILNNIYKSEHRNLFWLSLAAPSENGTMKRRLTKTAAEKRVRAKTGTMNNVSTICGYIKSRDDETIIFSVMFNNFTGPLSKVHNLQDLICMRLAGFTRYPERYEDK